VCCPSRLRTLLVGIAAGLALASPAAASTAASTGGARLTIPKLGLDVPLATSLNGGPYAYYQDRDTLAVAGHRTTYSRPFSRLTLLRRGDVIRMEGVRFLVRRSAVVRPRETWILNFRGLVLSTCHPAGSAAYRYVVFAAPAPPP
jgi:sortase (surface protein transpeptidase)